MSCRLSSAVGTLRHGPCDWSGTQSGVLLAFVVGGVVARCVCRVVTWCVTWVVWWPRQVCISGIASVRLTSVVTSFGTSFFMKQGSRTARVKRVSSLYLVV